MLRHKLSIHRVVYIQKILMKHIPVMGITNTRKIHGLGKSNTIKNWLITLKYRSCYNSSDWNPKKNHYEQK